MSNRRRIARSVVVMVVSIGVAGAAGTGGGALLLGAAPEDLGLRLVVLGLGFLVISGVVGWAVWRQMARWVDWRRVEAEQMLWESGPLGRMWLRIRQRLIDQVDP